MASSASVTMLSQHCCRGRTADARPGAARQRVTFAQRPPAPAVSIRAARRVVSARLPATKADQASGAGGAALLSAVVVAAAFGAVAAPALAGVEGGAGAVAFLAEVFPDPATAKVLILLLKPGLTVATVLFIVRIIMSWDPEIKTGELPWSIAFVPTEPLLAPTRRVIQPVGGVDIAPVVWLAVISLLNELLLGPQGILVMIANQVSLL